MDEMALGFPVLMSVAFSIVFVYGGTRIEVVRQELFSIRDRLGLETAPEYKVLTLLLYVCSAMFGLVAVGLLAMMTFVNVAV
jgi:hypothetical protein